MPNTYTQIHLQIVFVVKFRKASIEPLWKERLYQYIIGILKGHGHKMIAINGMPDHLHLLIGMRPNQSLSELVQDVKGSSSKWINEQGLTKERFAWQEGYGAFSYAKSNLPLVVRYIENQEEHHRKKTFQEEYLEFLQEFDVDYDPRYIMKNPE